MGFPAGRPCVILTPRAGWPLHFLSPSSAAHSRDWLLPQVTVCLSTGGRSSTGGETVLPRQNRLFPVWCFPCAVKLPTRVAGKTSKKLELRCLLLRPPSRTQRATGGGRVFLDPPATSLFLLGFPAGRPCVTLTSRVGWPLHSLSPSSAAHSKDCVNVNAPASLCLLCSKRKAPRAATGAQARPAREIRRRCACLPRARLFLVVGSRAASFSGGGARLAHKKQARRATRTAGAASCVAALVGLGRAAFSAFF